MNSSTTSPLGVDFPQQLLDAFNEATKQACQILWEAIKQAMMEHWLLLLAGLAFLLVIAVIKYCLTGLWGMLASVVYNYLYFGTLFVVISIFGPEIFASDYCKIFLTILYMVCFTLVGIFVNTTGIRKGWNG